MIFTIEDEDNIHPDLQKAIDNDCKIELKSCIGWLETSEPELLCGCTYRVEAYSSESEE